MDLLLEGVVMQTMLISTGTFLTKYILDALIFLMEDSITPFALYLFLGAVQFILSFFYWQFFPLNDDIKHRQPETRAIMNWIKQEHFTASASLHGVIILPLTLFVKLFD